MQIIAHSKELLELSRMTPKSMKSDLIVPSYRSVTVIYLDLCLGLYFDPQAFPYLVNGTVRLSLESGID